MIKNRYLGSFSRSDNNYNGIRVFAALLVTFGHSFDLSPGNSEFFHLLNLPSAHRLGLYMFFFISGYLVTQSAEYRNSVGFFLKSRLLRILPGLGFSLFITLVICAFLVKIFRVSPTSLELWYDYFFNNLSIMHADAGYLGLFRNNNLPDVTNGSLWSIPLETKCYAVILLALIMGAFLNRYTKIIGYFVVGLSCFYAIYLYGPNYFGTARIYCLTMFFLGSLIYQVKDFIPINVWLFSLLGMSIVLLEYFPAFSQPFIQLVFVAYSILFFAHISISKKLPGDYSYGIYLYSFPIQQIVAQFCSGLNSYGGFFLSTALVLPLAMFSWHKIESKFLKWKDLDISSPQMTMFFAVYLSILVRLSFHEYETWHKIASAVIGMLIFALLAKDIRKRKSFFIKIKV